MVKQIKNKIKEFNEVLESMNDDDFWTWVRGWFDEDYIMDVINDWDDDAKIEEIKTMRDIIKNGE